MQLTRSCSRARTSERGFALIAAIVLAVLYFALMELLLLDSSRELAEAQRFKARVIAAAMAENAAEHAAINLVNASTSTLPRTAVKDGWISGGMEKTGSQFDLWGEGETKGVIRQKARVEVRGSVDGGRIHIHYTRHSQ